MGAATSQSAPDAEAVPSSSNGHNPAPSWLDKSADAYVQAQEALKAGQPERAFEIMRREIARQGSGRGRFQRTMQLVELCVAAGKESIAQPLLDDLIQAIEDHKLDAWEDKETVAAALATVMRVSQKVQNDEGEKRKLFERICRLDPVRALTTG
jgi:type VI secretion system protein ImpA